jgi:hypothetical protein
MTSQMTRITDPMCIWISSGHYLPEYG